MIGAGVFLFNLEVEFLQLCKPLLMVTILQFPLCLYKLKRSVISVDDRLLTQNVMLPLWASLCNVIHLFIIGGVLLNFIGKCLTIIGH